MSNLMWQKERTFSCNIDFCRAAFDPTALQPRKKDLQCSLNELFLCFIKVHIWRNNKRLKKVNVFDFFKIGFLPFLTLPEPLCVGCLTRTVCSVRPRVCSFFLSSSNDPTHIIALAPQKSHFSSTEGAKTRISQCSVKPFTTFCFFLIFLNQYL